MYILDSIRVYTFGLQDSLIEREIDDFIEARKL